MPRLSTVSALSALALSALPLSVLTTTGCAGGGSQYNGTSMAEYFPFDGGRHGEFVNNDSTVPYHLLTEKLEPTELDEDSRETATFEVSKDDGTLLYAVKWSVRSNQAVRIEAWADYSAGVGAAFTVFDPPIDVVDAFMQIGDTTETSTGGMNFTGTYVGPEDCPVLWGGLDWEDCAHIKLDDGDGDDSAGPKFAGDYWVVARYGQAWMQLTGDAEAWKLSDYVWDTGSGE